MQCENCGKKFEPTLPARSEQRFCKPECRKAWHYRDRKEAAYRTKVEKAEDRMNGHDKHEDRPPLNVVLGLAGLASPKATIKIRGLTE